MGNSLSPYYKKARHRQVQQLAEGHTAPLRTSPAIGRSKHTHSHSMGGWGSRGGTSERHQSTSFEHGGPGSGQEWATSSGEREKD